ncbi:MAG: ABC transporter ATP-binding protein [Candidatus Bathyarchaeota archaeon]|nr:MAG: ABC transporter ATP-binding protein [Candidatus Bathyarchaeota archaeon]
MSILDVQGLRMYYSTLKGDVKAVDGIDLKVEKGEALGLVGESGCGKTTFALSILRLLPWNGRIVEGSIKFHDTDIVSMDEKEFNKDYRWKRLSYVFQGAMNALNPVFRTGKQIAEAILLHEDVEKDEAMDRARELFSLVGIDPERVTSYPHELSGGMKQRAMIAMALACNPEFIIADEPTTALDVIVQAQTLQVINDLRRKLGLTMMLITHDLSVVAQTCTTCAIMYAGKLMEYADIDTVFSDSKHPYTQALTSAFPSITESRRELESIEGAPPNLLDPPQGCRFNPRCPYRMDICTEEEPGFIELGGGHSAACHLLSKR